MQNCSDENVMALLLQHGRKPEDQAVRCLIKCANATNGLLIRMGLGEADERQSLFYLAMAEFIIQVRQGRFVLTGVAQICTYITEIARRKWLGQSRKLQNIVPELIETETPEPEDERLEIIFWALEKLEPSDRDILVAFYLYEIPLTDYAKQQGLSHATARQRLSRARERLKGFIQNR